MWTELGNRDFTTIVHEIGLRWQQGLQKKIFTIILLRVFYIDVTISEGLSHSYPNYPKQYDCWLYSVPRK
jgi:hypothetical protein